MTNANLLPCDGCGQLASPEHIARRLQRLEWTSRFRPLHIQSVFLATVAPENDADFLYAPETKFTGEAAALLSQVQISTAGKSNEQVLLEFQKRGFLLAHVLECPMEFHSEKSLNERFAAQLPKVATRIRRSLKPKRLVILSPELSQTAASALNESALGCPVLYAPIATI
jgi:hypothetical protein